MSTLENIVPPLELCKKIPEGKFADSALVWWGACVYPRLYPDGVRYDTLWHKQGTTPAPTLQEILDALARMELCPRLGAILPVTGNVVYSICADWNLMCKHGNNAAEAALKLWLEVNKGIKSKIKRKIKSEEK